MAGNSSDPPTPVDPRHRGHMTNRSLNQYPCKVSDSHWFAAERLAEALQLDINAEEHDLGSCGGLNTTKLLLPLQSLPLQLPLLLYHYTTSTTTTTTTTTTTITTTTNTNTMSLMENGWRKRRERRICWSRSLSYISIDQQHQQHYHNTIHVVITENKTNLKKKRD